MDEKSMEHGQEWSGQDPAGWYLSEKFDGCRAFWDGRNMWSRGGFKVKLPSSFLAALPAGVQLDGELFHPEKTPAHISNVMRARGSWQGVKYMVFDAPALPGTWPERIHSAEEIISGGGPVQCVPHRKCRNLKDAVQELRRVQSRGGEGIVLRAPCHIYKARRSASMLKFIEIN